MIGRIELLSALSFIFFMLVVVFGNHPGIIFWQKVFIFWQKKISIFCVKVLIFLQKISIFCVKVFIFWHKMRGRIFCAASASIKTAKSVRAQSNAKFMQIQNLYFFTCDLHRARLYLAIWHPTNPSQAGWERCAAQHNNVIIIIIIIVIINHHHHNRHELFVPSPIDSFFWFQVCKNNQPCNQVTFVCSQFTV